MEMLGCVGRDACEQPGDERPSLTISYSLAGILDQSLIVGIKGFDQNAF
jgi:hypothetical protein